MVSIAKLLVLHCRGIYKDIGVYGCFRSGELKLYWLRKFVIELGVFTCVHSLVKVHLTTQASLRKRGKQGLTPPPNIYFAVI
jgi:hypothetical protein